MTDEHLERRMEMLADEIDRRSAVLHRMAETMTGDVATHHRGQAYEAGCCAALIRHAINPRLSPVENERRATAAILEFPRR